MRDHCFHKGDVADERLASLDGEQRQRDNRTCYDNGNFVPCPSYIFHMKVSITTVMTAPIIKEESSRLRLNVAWSGENEMILQEEH